MNETFAFNTLSSSRSDCDTTTSGPSSSRRNTGRFAIDRRVHFQSSASSGEVDFFGNISIASNNVLRVTLTTRFAPEARLIFSRMEGRKDGALTLIAYRPGSNPLIE